MNSSLCGFILFRKRKKSGPLLIFKLAVLNGPDKKVKTNGSADNQI